MANDGSAAVSSERTISDVAAPSLPNSLSSAHYFVNIKLTSKNFLFWRAQLVPFLHDQNLKGYIDDFPPSLPATVPLLAVEASSAVSDRAIMSMIISSLSEEVMPLVLGKWTSMAARKAIELALASTSRARAVHLLGQLQSLQQGEASVADYLGRVKVLLEDLVLGGRPLVSLEEMADLRGAQEFAHAYEFSTAAGSLAPVINAVARRGAGRSDRRVG
nr:uncharacterized protein LOC109146934 [Ipomoea batatas]